MVDQRTIRILTCAVALWWGVPLSEAWSRPPLWQTTAVPAEFQSAPEMLWGAGGPPFGTESEPDGGLWEAAQLGEPRWPSTGGEVSAGAWFSPEWVSPESPEPWAAPSLFERVGGWLGALARRIGMGGADGDSASNGSANLALYENTQVQKFMRLFLESHREAFMRGLERAGQYIPMIQEIFQREGLPADLAYLAIVESNLNPRALSPKRAAGLWQFMRDTAVHFGLRVEPWYDERLDPVLSTEAAARMLRYLHSKFGNWELALAAYNAGEGRVIRALRITRTSGDDEDFWNLSLPLQTRRYVPSFIAVALIYNDLEAHGFAQFEPETLLKYEESRGRYHTTLREIARRTGMSLSMLAELNPAWRQGLIPPVHEGEVLLRLPPGGRARVEAALKVGGFSPPRLVTHRVARGETLSSIASRYGVDMDSLLAANRIPNRNILRHGRELLIPLPSRMGGAIGQGDKT